MDYCCFKHKFWNHYQVLVGIHVLATAYRILGFSPSLCYRSNNFQHSSWREKRNIELFLFVDFCYLGIHRSSHQIKWMLNGSKLLLIFDNYCYFPKFRLRRSVTWRIFLFKFWWLFESNILNFKPKFMRIWNSSMIKASKKNYSRIQNIENYMLWINKIHFLWLYFSVNKIFLFFFCSFFCSSIL